MDFKDIQWVESQVEGAKAEQRFADGVTTDVLASQAARVAQLEREVARQSVALNVLTQLLIERGGVDGASLKARFDAAMAQLQAQASLVTCGRCKRQVEKRKTRIGPDGALCEPCYQALEHP